MKRLLISFAITLALGLTLYFVFNLVKGKDEQSIDNTPVEETYEFDISYGTQTTLEEVEEKIKNKEELIVFIGNQEEKATKKVSNILGKVENIETLKVYYLEKEEELKDEEKLEQFLNDYQGLSNYIPFTPVILVFKNNTLIGGLPGEIEERNLITFLQYTEMI